MKIHLIIKSSLVPRFFPLLQQGFMVEAQVGCSIKSLLCDQLGLGPEYVEKTIQTIFLNGKAVDDVNSAIVKKDSILALSAAMPGLVGAILRKGGHYASMRTQISHREDMKSQTLEKGTVVLKLFNLLTRELGPTFLERGFWIKGKDLANFLSKQPPDFWAGRMESRIDGNVVDTAGLRDMKWPDDEIFLQLRIHN